jgi:hypothetical protein
VRNFAPKFGHFDRGEHFALSRPFGPPDRAIRRLSLRFPTDKSSILHQKSISHFKQCEFMFGTLQLPVYLRRPRVENSPSLRKLDQKIDVSADVKILTIPLGFA